MAKSFKTTNSNKPKYDCVNNFPDWYWVRGLHDAKILEINSNVSKNDSPCANQKREYIELVLDSSGAMFDYNVDKLTLYDCKIIYGYFPDCAKEAAWWLWDELKLTDDGKYSLDLELDIYPEDKPHFHKQLRFTFSHAKVVRNRKNRR